MYRDKYIEGRNAARIVKALSNDYRVQILEILDEEDSTIQNIMARVRLSKTALMSHLYALETTGFISSTMVRGSVGNQKLYHKEYDRLIYNFTQARENAENEQYYEIRTGVGNFFDFKIYPPCGLATEEHIIQKWDDPSVFFHPDRVKARLIWGALGYVEYRVPLNIPFDEQGFSRIEVIMEASAQGDLPDHKQLRLPRSVRLEQLSSSESLLTFFINGVPIADHTVLEYSRIGRSGQLTGAKGKYTPGWWKGSNYGELLTLIIDDQGVRINGETVSKIVLSDLLPPSFFEDANVVNRDLQSDSWLSFRVAVREDAERICGFTLYGEGFGNYDHPIIFRFFPKM